MVPTGQYFAVLNIEFEPKPMNNKGGKIGIDVGIKEFYSDSNGNVALTKETKKRIRYLIKNYV